MTTRHGAAGRYRYLSFGAAAGSLVLLAAVVLMLWPMDPAEYGFTPGRDHPDGETVGWVSKVDSNTIHVNSGPFGGGVVPLVITKVTKIKVGSKEGWFEDIRPGGQVKVAYELYQGRRFARTVELLVDEGSRRPSRPPQTKGLAGAPATERATPAPTPAPSAAPVPAPAPAPVPAAVPAPRPVPAVAKPAAAPAPAEVRSAPRPETAPLPAPPRPQAPEIGPPPRPTTATATRNVSAPDPGARAPEPVRPIDTPRPPAPRPAEPARGAESSGDSGDGSAAVDWLLRNRR